MKMFDEKDLMTVKQAAALRGTTHQAIWDLIKRKRLKTVEIMGRPYLSKEDVQAFKPDPRGRHSKNKAKAASHKAA